MSSAPSRALAAAGLCIIGVVLSSCDSPPSSPVEPPNVDAQNVNAAPRSMEETATGATADQYIVVFRDDTKTLPGLAKKLSDESGGELKFEYSEVFPGFAAKLPPQALDGLRRNPYVALIVPDGIVQTENIVQLNATWGMDRIDQRVLPLDKSYNYAFTGYGTSVYILDSGIRFDHEEFEGRAVRGFDAIGDGLNGEDCSGHGTHVAGTVAGKTHGLAKQARVFSVRVLGCDGTGSYSGIIAGLDWVAKNHTKPAVANMSLGGVFSDALNTAVRNLIKAGVQVSIAAGNQDIDACQRSPGSTTEAVVVGATTSTDARASFSNWGSCVDVFAPGYAITAAVMTSPTSTGMRTGTSMAAPHAAGVMALWLHENPALTPAQLHGMIVSNATQNVVTNARSVNAHLLHSLRGTSAPPTPPTAMFSANCAGLTCSFDASASTGGGASVARYDWTFGDLSSGSGVTSSRNYASGGSYTVTLTVTNAEGMSSQTSRTVSVSTANQAPVARFTVSCKLLACAFTDGSSDADGTVASWAWSFGDGGTSVTRDASRAFATAGTYSVRLTVTDNAGSTGSSTQSVTVSAAPPTAVFTYTCTAADCTFTDGSLTSSSVRQWAWTFGDGGTANVQNPPHSYVASGTYSVRLEVTDGYGQKASTTRSVTVSVPAPATGIKLTASPYKIKGLHTVGLNWSGAASSHVTLYRNGTLLRTVTNSGSYTDFTSGSGRADYRYRVCEIGTGVCSNEVLVEFR